MEKLSTIKILDRALQEAMKQDLSMGRELARNYLYHAIVHQMEFSNREYRS